MSGESWNEVMEREKRKAQPNAALAGLLPPPLGEALPGPGSEYKAASRPSHAGLTHLVVILGGKEFQNGRSPYRFFQYVHLGADAELGFVPGGQVMRFHFTGMNPAQLVVTGRSFLQLCDMIQSHRIHWIRQADRDFHADEAIGDDGQPLPFIQSIEIVPLSLTHAMGSRGSGA